jgi:hypothetical protein
VIEYLHQAATAAGVIEYLHQAATAAGVIEYLHQAAIAAGVIEYLHQAATAAGVIEYLNVPGSRQSGRTDATSASGYIRKAAFGPGPGNAKSFALL